SSDILADTVLGVIFLVILSGSLARSRSTRSRVLLELVLTFVADNYRRWEKLRIPISTSYVDR
ncbi:MAG: hypothetical protein VXY99_03195, partial [Pseudomonadota bacterium]|nr:hypothetical protein [Pseudomonadota bacterium]